MYKKIVSAFCGCLLVFSLYGQDASADRLLDQIGKNNQQLKAYRSFISSRTLGNKAENNLPNPQASAYYLPFGEHQSDDYYEYQISQRFEFPTVYGARSKRIEKQKQLLELEYEVLRQDVLLDAKKQLLELQALQKRKELEQKRVEQAKQVYDQIQRLFDTEQIGILELNKAKVAWMQQKFAVDQVNSEIRNSLLQLQKLNGGEPVEVEEVQLVDAQELKSMENLWQEKLNSDAEVQIQKAEEALAEQQVRLEKNKILPDLMLGYNHQGVNASNYSGIMGGISIPLWNSRNKVKSARANYEYEQADNLAMTAELYTRFQERFHQYQLLKEKFEEYQDTFEGLNSEELLFKAYDLGELSFLDYYREVEFYREAYNNLLEMQKELSKLKAELLKHQL